MFTHIYNFFHDHSVASVAPTSPSAVHRICRRLNLASARVVVEYGPGDGAFTKYLLKRLPANATLLAIETNEGFIRILKSTITDPRLQVIHDSAEQAERLLNQLMLERADYVISGIPFSFLSPRTKRKILNQTARILKPGGRLVVYQALSAPRGLQVLRRHLLRMFEIVQHYSVLLTVPPLYVFECVPIALDSRISSPPHVRAPESRSGRASFDKSGAGRSDIR